MQFEHRDVLIIGAGISGIGAAAYLQRRCPQKSYAILESRDSLGGTWDLFRYPGIRSDSDMFTLGYSFKPWTAPNSIADGPSILNYVRETAIEEGILPQIRFQHRVKRAIWSSDDALWTVEVEHGGRSSLLTANYLLCCTGYYRYDAGYQPTWPGMDRFQGRLVHPQKWPEDLDYAGRRIVVIGSGATAVTLIPALAKTAAHVTMLQRSPTYMVSLPATDPLADTLRKTLPQKLAYRIIRAKNVVLQMIFYRLARRRPDKTKEQLIGMVREQLGPDYDIDTHFTPKYKPWDQRLCVVPDHDLFEAIKSGRASVVTDQIESFTERGVQLKSGQELEADIIVSATGLALQHAGGMEVVVDGDAVVWSEKLAYKGMMFSDVPNFAAMIGYTNASWTLKVELSAKYFCRMINFMDRRGYAQFTPTLRNADVQTRPILNLTSGYVKRSEATFPKQGTNAPWRLYQNYLMDLLNLRFGFLQTGEMEFRRRSAPATARMVQTPVGAE